MIQSDYALSYNVKEIALDVLKSIYNFDTWSKANRFMLWFNKVIEMRGRVTLNDICNKMSKTQKEAFSRVGFDAPISEFDIHEIVKQDGTKKYQIIFPILKDFTQRGVR